MMQLTFILGNGFDKAIELKTGYGDFYKWWDNPQLDEADEVKLLKRTIQDEIAKGNDKWADFEYALGQFTAVVTDKRKYINCFECARNSLITYLQGIYADARAANKDFLKSATYCLIELSQKTDRNWSDDQKTHFSISKDVKTIFNCISFNYTPILSHGQKDLTENAHSISSRDGWWGTYEIGRTLNVHGQLDDFPILGVDNPSQIANENFRKEPDILQLMVKGEIDARLGRNWRKDAREIIADSDKIYVYGASLGDTDEYWWRTIAQWFEADIENRQLALYCHPLDSKEKLKKEQERFVKNISKHFARGDYSARIVVDSVIKSMTVSFVYAAANTTIHTHGIAYAEVVPASEIESYLKE